MPGIEKISNFKRYVWQFKLLQNIIPLVFSYLPFDKIQLNIALKNISYKNHQKNTKNNYLNTYFDRHLFKKFGNKNFEQKFLAPMCFQV